MSTVTDFLDGKGIAHEVLPHPRAYTGLDEARSLGLDADEVLKTVIVDTHEEHVAVVVPSEERLDMRLVREVLQDPEAHLAPEHELSEDFADWELGALPPIAPLLGIDVIVDPTVRDHGRVAFANGSQTESVLIDVEDLLEVQPVRFAQVTTAWR